MQPQIDRPHKVAEEAPAYNIPAVIDRPLKVDDGEKIFVTRFEIQGATDHPEDNLYVKNFLSLLGGYKSQHTEGMTVGQLQEAANLVRDAYRKAGYPVAQAFIPAQDVKDGVVKVSVLEGVLGGVVVEKNTLYSEKMIKQGTANVVGKPVRISSLESALMKINDYPGMDVLGVLRPGKRVGEAELVLNAQNEDPYEFFVTADNQGTVATGQSRVFAGATANNLLGLADRLDFVALRTFSPSDSLYGSLYYEAQTPVPSLRAGGGYSVNAYNVGKAYAPLPVAGKTVQWDAYLLNNWQRSRRLSMSSRFDL
ncbi:MAG TPA: POTRA domain-containing protein, partial [Pseudomonadales bacterium]|nr:POTRA domain-containing protein [Pseudomonadales bacterium]